MYQDTRELKIGDVVLLDGVQVTLGLISSGCARCVWFDKDDKLHKEIVPLSRLQRLF